MTKASTIKIAPKHFTCKRWYPWVVILVAATFLFYKYVLQVSPNIMSSQFMHDFKISGRGLGFLAASFFFAYFAMQLFVGVLLDRFSLRWLSGIAIAVSAVGAMLFAYAHHVVGAEVFRALMGMGAAFATVCYLKAGAIWFPPKKFAFVSGLAATASMAGAVFGETPLAYLVQFVGWRASIFICGIAGLLLSVLFISVVRDAPKVSFEPLSETDKKKVCWRSIGQVLVSPQNWLLAFYSGMTFSPIAVLGGLWGNMFLERVYGLSTTTASTVVSFSFLGLAVGGPAMGAISDKLGRRKPVMLTGNILAFVGLVPVIYWPELSVTAISVLLFIFGFGVGAFMLGFAMGKEINSIAVAATVIALVNSGDAIFGAVTEPVVGQLLDWHWQGVIVDGVRKFTLSDFQIAFTVMPAYIIIAALLLLLVKEQRANHGPLAGRST